MTLEDLQEARNFTLKTFPVVWLENSSKLLHLDAPHGWLPGDSREVAVRVARTRRSLKFLGQRKAISSGCSKVLRNRSQAWRLGRWCLVVRRKDGKIGSYVTTKGIRAGFSWFDFNCRQASRKLTNNWTTRGTIKNLKRTPPLDTRRK